MKPEVTLGQYKGIEVDKADITATDKEVEDAIEKREKIMQEQSLSMTDQYRMEM